ncbi:very short patch repair endonuclease [Dyella silvae]|uniref:very short patch repair endonuclease n=1 Tax=Dyella silvae TaxID=2994424 RepID=UPI002B27B27A|nr:very short patch repair endonuclease [Dyella silvae]
MTDVHNPEQRSRNMRAIGPTNTAPELQVRKALHAAGLRFRLHVRDLPGTPDLVLPKYRSVIFVHGCFWHGHDCHLFKVPATGTSFWLKKIESNRHRDATTSRKLLDEGWRVLTIWECALKGRNKLPISEVTERTHLWLCSEYPLGTIRGTTHQATTFKTQA